MLSSALRVMSECSCLPRGRRADRREIPAGNHQWQVSVATASGSKGGGPHPPGRGSRKCAAAPILFNFNGFQAQILVSTSRLKIRAARPLQKMTLQIYIFLATLLLIFIYLKVYRPTRDQGGLIEDALK